MYHTILNKRRSLVKKVLEVSQTLFLLILVGGDWLIDDDYDIFLGGLWVGNFYWITQFCHNLKTYVILIGESSLLHGPTNKVRGEGKIAPSLLQKFQSNITLLYITKHFVPFSHITTSDTS